MRIEEIMTRNVAFCTPETPLKDVAMMMVDCDCGVIPVAENREGERLTGMVTDRDIVCRLVAQGRDPTRAPARDAMSSPVYSVRPDTDIEEACELMERHQVRRLAVCDDDGRCIGIVSQADLARRLDEHHTAEVVRYVSEPTGSARV